MVLAAERVTNLNLIQRVAVAQSRYIPGGSRGELVISELDQVPTGLRDNMTAFQLDLQHGVQKMFTQDYNDKGEIRWYEVFFFGQIKNIHRERIARYFGFDETKNQQLEATEMIGPYQKRRLYFVT